MKKSEFERYFKSEGINLRDYKIFIGKTNMPDCMGCYYENGVWVSYEVDDRQDFSIRSKGTEDEIFDELFSKAKHQIRWMQRNS